MGLACAAKYPLLLFAPGTLLLVGHRRGYALTAAWAVGLALPLAGVAWLNLHLFGSIWLTGHDRILTFGADGLPGVYSQRSSFGDPLVPGMMGQLLDRQHGLLMTSPITILSLIGLLPLARARFALGAHLLTSAAALFVFYAGYRLWPASHYGNRFLMPVVVLAVLPLAALLQAVATKLSGFTSPDPRARTSP